jgi:hypothetical protein
VKLLRTSKIQVDEGGFLDELQLLDLNLLFLDYFSETGSVAAEHTH